MPSVTQTLPLAAALAAFAAAPCALAQSTSFTISPIAINGNANFDANGINKAGTVVGTLFDASAGTQTAMEISRGTATALPNPDSSDGPFIPRAINDRGDVLGYAVNSGLGNTVMFLFQAGTFNSAYSVPLVQPGNAQNAPPLPISFTNNLVVSFNTIFSIDLVSSSYGHPSKFHSVPGQNRFTHVNSVNATGVVAGTDYSFNGITSVYTGKGKVFTAITPPNAKNVIGGYINNANTVAGSFEDTSGAWHGFTYSGGTVTTFDPPLVNGAANTSVTVDAINNSGRVVGVYTDSTGAQHGFLSNGTTVSAFGTYPAGDGVAVAISNKGGIVVADASSAAANSYQSATVVCKGTGC